MRGFSEMGWEGGRADHEMSVAEAWKWIRGVASIGMPEKRLPTPFLSRSGWGNEKMLQRKKNNLALPLLGGTDLSDHD